MRMDRCIRGPIGAILTPQLMHLEHAQTLPYASSLCGACYDVCPVKINIPEVLIDLRAQVTDKEREEERRFFDPMYLGMRIANFFFASAGRFRFAQRMGRLGLRLFTRKDGWIHSLPSIGARWTMTRDLRGLPQQTFREWWAGRNSVRARRADECFPGRDPRTGARMPPRNGAKDVTASYAALERGYIRAGQLNPEERIALMIERLREYDAEVVECSPDHLPDTIAAQLATSGRRSFVIPPALPASWLAPGFEWKVDRGLSTSEIEKADGVVTAIVLRHCRLGNDRAASPGNRRTACHQLVARLAFVRSAGERCCGDIAGILRTVRRPAGIGNLYFRPQRDSGYRNDAHQGRARSAVSAGDHGA